MRIAELGALLKEEEGLRDKKLFSGTKIAVSYWVWGPETPFVPGGGLGHRVC